MAAKPKFAHVVFQTSQPAEMRDWYCTVLDGHVVYQDAALTFITFDDEHHRVALLNPPVPLERKTPATAAMHHVAYTFENLDDLLDRYVLLRDQGIRRQTRPAGVDEGIVERAEERIVHSGDSRLDDGRLR